jgi:hypothetical protein
MEYTLVHAKYLKIGLKAAIKEWAVTHHLVGRK